MSELTGSNHRCRAQLFKCVQTVVGQHFSGNWPNGLSYYYYTTTTTDNNNLKIYKVLLKPYRYGADILIPDSMEM